MAIPIIILKLQHPSGKNGPTKLLIGKYNWFLICLIKFFIKLHLLFLFLNSKKATMNKLFRGLIAAYGAKKLGGGCISTVIVFIIIYVALGHVHC